MSNNKKFSVELTSTQWTVVLAALDGFFHGIVVPRLKELRDNKIDITTLPKTEVMTLGGSLEARSTIIDAMVKAGVLRQEAGNDMGMKAAGAILGKLQDATEAIEEKE